MCEAISQRFPAGLGDRLESSQPYVWGLTLGSDDPFKGWAMACDVRRARFLALPIFALAGPLTSPLALLHIFY